MPQFLAQDNVWSIRLDAINVELIRSDCGVDLVTQDGASGLSDPLLLARVIASLIAGQNGATESACLRMLSDDKTRRRAGKALAKAIAGWWPTEQEIQSVSPEDDTEPPEGRPTLFCNPDPVVRCLAFAGRLGVSPAGLTYRQLWLMFHGAQQASRAVTTSQADLVAMSVFTGGMSGGTLAEFICSGSVPDYDAAPYDQETLKQIVKSSGGRMGEIK